MKVRNFLALLVLPVLATWAHAASFNCSKAQRPVEKAICGNTKLNAADEQMGRIYRGTLGKLSPGSVGVLRADQVQWLAWAQEVCHTGDAQTSTTAIVKCLLPVYDDRTKQLRTAVIQRNVLTFLTRTQFLAEPDHDPADLNGPGFPGFGVLKASWPMADSTDARWVSWNKAVEAHAFVLAGRGGDDAAKKLLPQDPVWTPNLAAEQNTDVIGQIKSVEHDRVTTNLNLETMGHGAAHPNEAFETLTWLLNSDRPLRAEDVFAPGSTWKQQVAAACWKAISTGEQKVYLYPEVSGPDAQPLQDVFGDVGNWTLEHDGLHISYPEYSVAPRVSSMDDTVIPWTQLKPVLASGFIAP